MKILVMTSCTGEKKFEPAGQLVKDDFLSLHHPAEFLPMEETLAAYKLPAEEMYTGQQHVRLMRGVAGAREKMGADNVSLWIVSAGYGVVPGDRPIVPYEATFQGMKTKELSAWAKHLGVPEGIRKVLSQKYDLGIVLLGDSYLAACDLDEGVVIGGPTLFFCGSIAAKKFPAIPSSKTVALTNKEAKRFSCGLVALKGELAARLLVYAIGDLEVKKLLDPQTDVLGMLDSQGATRRRSPPAHTIGKPDVDRVIDIPTSWWEKPHRSKLRYFIPEWDDLVDRDFNFENDIHSGGRGDWSNEVYAHQLYPEPNYDGILISKVVAEKHKAKKRRINEMGVHRYVRVPPEFPIMGDCGAFGYIMEDVPPYTTEEILDYYTRLGFNYGVSVDHLIVSATEHQKLARYDLTIHNAEDFLLEHRKQGLPWEPVGAVQGWDPKSYAEAARHIVAMGYKYIGLGGLVRSSSTSILDILHEVHKVVPDSVSIHLFGLARIRALSQFADLGVRSVDSASFLRRAWMGTGENYLTESGELYAAIRIPEGGKSFRAKRMVQEGRASESQVKRLERGCLVAMREFDQGRIGVEETLDALEEYDSLITPDRASTRPLLKKALEAKPWKTCNCDICKRDGIQVIIFRGNNRNRRRGFHNTYVFYRLLQRALSGEKFSLGEEESSYKQPGLFESSGEGA